MIKFFKQLAKNKKGSEVVEKIFMVVVSLAIAAIAVTWITNLVKNSMDKQGVDSVDDTTTRPSDPYAA